MDIFKLVGSIYVDNSKANDSISKTSKEAEGLGSKLKNGVGTAAKWAAGIGAAAVAVGTAMVASAKATASNMDVIDKGAQRMKVSTDSYQELSHAASLCGVEMSTLEKAAKKLEGTGLNLDDALNEIYSLESAEERAAKASELFGETVAYSMTPMLNASAEEMSGMRQEAHDLGIVMSEETVAAGATLNDQFTKVQESFSAVTNQIGAKLMPVISKVLDWILEHMPEIQETVGTVLTAIMDAISALMPVIEALWPIIENLWNNLVKPLLDAVCKFLTGVFTGDIKGAFKGIVDGVKVIFSAILSVLKAPLDKFLTVLSSWWQKATEPFRKLGDAIGSIWESIKSKFKLPHFTLSGSLNPLKWIDQGMPKIGVEWYAKGGIMNDPTAFGYNPFTGNAMVGGEAGAEAIAPISTLEDYFKKWSVNDELNEKVDNIINIIASYLPDIANKKLILDTGAIVGGMSDSLNKSLYKSQSKEKRGL